MKKTYQYHKPGDDGVKRIQELRANFSMLHDLIERNSPASREQSVALTQLETAAMWAIKAVVVNDPESVVEDIKPGDLVMEDAPTNPAGLDVPPGGVIGKV